MLLVVLGAGASYDSVNPRKHGTLDERDRPPLADDLFHPRFRPTFRQFPQIAGIVDRLRDLPSGTHLEHVLETIQAEASAYPKRHEQLAAVKFYLQHVLHSCGNSWDNAADHATNYVALFDRVDAWRHERGEKVLIVTFNYDLLIERALGTLLGIAFDEVGDWIEGPNYHIFKLHGSVNWTHPVTIPDHPEPISVREMIDAAGRGELRVSPHFRRIDNPGDLNSTGDVYPALAIPVVSKSGFECPSEHVDVLNKALPHVDRVLVVGWRGTEASFVDMWSQAVDANRVRRTLFVAESEDSARETTMNVDRIGTTLANVYHFGEGFSGFIEGDEVKRFLDA